MAAAPSLPLILAREFAANVATPFLVLDREGTLVYFNEHAERLIGSTPGELCRRPVHETLVYTSLNGQRRVLEVTATPLLGRGDDLEGVFLLFWEVV